MSKIGAGALGAAGRAGLKELAQVLPAFPEAVKPVEEPGAPGNLVAQEVLAAKQPDKGFEADVQQAAQAAKDARSRERGKDMDRD